MCTKGILYRFQRFQHCKVSPKLPVLPLTDKPRRFPPQRRSSRDGRGRVRRTLAPRVTSGRAHS